ncbi:hypothetical protein GCM10020218_000700 [Dactylosporangium vinaceum]
MVLKVDVPPALVSGAADEGYGPVADAFRRNFAERGEIGAACAVYRDGRKVVDLWGGYRDGRAREPWREDTLVTVFFVHCVSRGPVFILPRQRLVYGVLVWVFCLSRPLSMACPACEIACGPAPCVVARSITPFSLSSVWS